MKKAIFFITLFFFGQLAFGQTTATETLDINSKVFNNVRKVKVNLPAEYAEYPNRSYKVIYLFDAQSDPLFNFVKETNSYLNSNVNIYVEPVILVGIVTTNRQFEFLPKNRTDQPFKDYSPKVKLGGADSLAISLRDEVMPLIKSKYRINGYNIAIGHSLGGSFITYALVKFPELFNAVIAISPNYYYDHEQLLSTFDSLATTKILQNKFFYIAYGKGDKLEERFRPSSIRMESNLKRKSIIGLRWRVQSLDNDSHGTTPLEGIFKGLILFNKDLTATDEQTDIFLKNKKTFYIDNLKAYYKKQTIATGLQLPTIGDINRLAYNSFYAQNKSDAIKIMQWGISLYPDDANLFDSMGEFQQDAGNTKEAKFYYSEGLKITEKQKLLLLPAAYQGKINWFTGRIKGVETK